MIYPCSCLLPDRRSVLQGVVPSQKSGGVGGVVRVWTDAGVEPAASMGVWWTLSLLNLACCAHFCSLALRACRQLRSRRLTYKATNIRWADVAVLLPNQQVTSLVVVGNQYNEYTRVQIHAGRINVQGTPGLHAAVVMAGQS